VGHHGLCAANIDTSVTDTIDIRATHITFVNSSFPHAVCASHPLRQHAFKHEKAARQQGGFFFRENSSNGGKAIRTFWRNTMVGKIACQG